MNRKFPPLIKIAAPHDARYITGTLADCGEFKRLNPPDRMGYLVDTTDW